MMGHFGTWKKRNLFSVSCLENVGYRVNHYGSRKHGALDFMIMWDTKIDGIVSENTFGSC